MAGGVVRKGTAAKIRHRVTLLERASAPLSLLQLSHPRGAFQPGFHRRFTVDTVRPQRWWPAGPTCQGRDCTSQRLEIIASFAICQFSDEAHSGATKARRLIRGHAREKPGPEPQNETG